MIDSIKNITFKIQPWVYNSIVRNLDGSHVDALHMKLTNMDRFTFLSPLLCAPLLPQNVSILEADLAAKHGKFGLDMGSPMWIGEFGAYSDCCAEYDRSIDPAETTRNL